MKFRDFKHLQVDARRIQEDIVKGQLVELSIEERILFPQNYSNTIPGILIVHVSVLTKDFHQLKMFIRCCLRWRL